LRPGTEHERSKESPQGDGGYILKLSVEMARIRNATNISISRPATRTSAPGKTWIIAANKRYPITTAIPKGVVNSAAMNRTKFKAKSGARSTDDNIKTITKAGTINNQVKGLLKYSASPDDGIGGAFFFFVMGRSFNQVTSKTTNT